MSSAPPATSATAACERASTELGAMRSTSGVGRDVGFEGNREQRQPRCDLGRDTLDEFGQRLAASVGRRITGMPAIDRSIVTHREVRRRARVLSTLSRQRCELRLAATHFLEQSRLARAWFTDDLDDAAVSGSSRARGFEQHTQLFIAPDQIEPADLLALRSAPRRRPTPGWVRSCPSRRTARARSFRSASSTAPTSLRMRSAVRTPPSA